jgi:hypothetical protein
MFRTKVAMRIDHGAGPGGNDVVLIAQEAF